MAVPVISPVLMPRSGVRLVAAWEARIRRALLVAHAGPALFGLVAVLAGFGRGETRMIDVLAWCVVLAWSVFVLVAGWGRAATGAKLAPWILADGLVMAGLMFVGTPARQVVHYVAIDGALFAAAFVSTRLGIVQLGMVFSGLLAAAVARHHGSSIPSPLVGWLLPLLVPLAGIIAFGYLRNGLGRLRIAMSERELLMDQSRLIMAESAAQDATLRGLDAIDRVVAPAMEQLTEAADRYARSARSMPAARDEIGWLAACLERANRDLVDLRAVVGQVEVKNLAEAIDTGILGASAVHVFALEVHWRVVGDDRADLPSEIATAVVGFVREAVTNAVVHGSPPIEVIGERVSVGRLSVHVMDAGRGPQSGNVTGEGLGREAMSGYASDVGARLEHSVGIAGYQLSFVLDRPAAK